MSQYIKYIMLYQYVIIYYTLYISLDTLVPTFYPLPYQPHAYITHFSTNYSKQVNSYLNNSRHLTAFVDKKTKPGVNFFSGASGSLQRPTSFPHEAQSTCRDPGAPLRGSRRTASVPSASGGTP